MSDNTLSGLRHRRSTIVALFVAAAAMCGLALTTTGCQSDDTSEARAYQSSHRAQLIGGPGSRGEVGDWIIENDEIRLVIQHLDGFNRGTGLFEGSLIDADLVRQDAQGDPFGSGGRDTFNEIFPVFLVEIIDPRRIVTVDPGELNRDDISDDAAILEVRGDGGELVSMARFFNQAMVNAYDPTEQLGDLLDGGLPDSDGEPLIEFTARYILEPGDRHVRIENEMTNVNDGPLTFPNSDIVAAADFILDDMFGDDNGDDDNGDDPLDDLDLSEFSVPVGSAVGVGAYNSLFLPGIGFDVRYGLEDTYRENPVELPGLPGHVTDIVATASDEGVSYGFATLPDPDGNYVYNNQEFYDVDVSDRDLLFVFEGAGFGATFSHQIPQELESGETFTATNAFVVGSGDVSSLRDEIYDAHGVNTQTVTGRILDETTGEPVGDDAEILFYESTAGSCDADDEPTIFNQTDVSADGYFQAQLPVGDAEPGHDYCYRTRDRRETSDFVGFDVSADEPTELNATAPGHGRVEAYITDQTGNPIPAKMTITGQFEPRADEDTRHFLFDLVAGERWRPVESVDLDPDDGPAEYIEMIEFSDASGHASAEVEPGDYTVYFSRGNEYELVEKEIEVGPGDVTHLDARVERQFNPDGYLSGDYHMHGGGSMDSALDYNDRVVSIAGEGVEVVVSSDHNYVADYMPYIERNNLQPFLRSVIGVELTTLEAGHFNVFPIHRDIASQNRGSVAWQHDPPDEIFERLRDKGPLGPDDTIIQVNHPRDGILGYFGQHNVDPLTGVAELPINTVEGTDRAIAGATSPNGPAFAEPVDDPDDDRKFQPTFSYDFEAIELYNGKRMHLLHHFRMPYDRDEMPDEVRDELSDEEFESLPENEGVILCDDDEVAYPGALDDWYNFLNYPRPDGEYVTYTGTANSDSHHYGAPDDPEPGFPRNYFWAGHNDPRQLDQQDLSDAIQDHHNISTNGPFINMSVEGEPVGSTVPVDDATVTLELETKATDWVAGDDGLYFDLVANGERIMQDRAIDLDDDGRWSREIDIDLDDYDHLHYAEDDDQQVLRDTWFVLEVHGDNNLFPVVQPAEIPQIPFEEALGELAEPFGVGQTPGDFAPGEVQNITPFAFTNPVWVVDDTDGDGRTDFTPPEPPPGECVDDEFVSTELVSADDDVAPFGQRRLDAQNTEIDFHHDHVGNKFFEPDEGELSDVRNMFDHWHDH